MGDWGYVYIVNLLRVALTLPSAPLLVNSHDMRQIVPLQRQMEAVSHGFKTTDITCSLLELNLNTPELPNTIKYPTYANVHI